MAKFSRLSLVFLFIGNFAAINSDECAVMATCAALLPTAWYVKFGKSRSIKKANQEFKTPETEKAVQESYDIVKKAGVVCGVIAVICAAWLTQEDREHDDYYGACAKYAHKYWMCRSHFPFAFPSSEHDTAENACVPESITNMSVDDFTRMLDDALPTQCARPAPPKRCAADEDEYQPESLAYLLGNKEN